MELPSSGVNLEIWDEVALSWLNIKDSYFEEAKVYSLRCLYQENIQLCLQKVPVPMYRKNQYWYGNIQTPFQSGSVNFSIKYGQETYEVKQFIYPDSRKISKQQYELMLSEILEEGQLCFQYSGLHYHFDSKDRAREISWLQWDYIERSILELRKTFFLINRNPKSILKESQDFIKKEKIKNIKPQMITWIERFGEANGGNFNKPPKVILTQMKEETYDLYENRVIKRQLRDLKSLLKYYVRQSGYDDISFKAAQYIDWINNWTRQSFLDNLTAHSGVIRVSQVFKKQPAYRKWFQWFQRLYEFRNLSFGLKHSIPLKDTFQLYEMWAYMKVVGIFRENKLIESTEGLFTNKEVGLFLSLAENKESIIKLKNGGTLTYQKIIQFNTSPYFSYTHRMIPDITIEWQNKLYILDPKYRIDSNIALALGEMHKYRDGIIKREDQSKVVEEIYILTPTDSNSSTNKDFYSSSYHSAYKMGAFVFKPGKYSEEFNIWVKENLLKT